MKKTVYNKELINIIFVFSVENAVNYSEFVRNIILNSWNNYYLSGFSIKHLNKLNKNVDKINKNDSLTDTFFENLNTMILCEIKNIDKKSLDSIFIEMRKYDNLRDFLYYLIDISKSFRIIYTKVKLPKLKENKNDENENIYFDKSGYAFFNVKTDENGNLILDKKSFNKERYTFFENLKNKKKNYCDNKNKSIFLSPYEKKRRIYLENMYKLSLDMVVLESKKFDITYPVDKYYEISNKLVSILYNEIVDFDKENGALGILKNKTISTYGSVIQIEKYKEIYINFYKNVDLIDTFIKNEYIDFANNCKKDVLFKKFKDINYLIPNCDDIYKCVNQMVVNNFVNNMDLYGNDLKKVVNKFCKYMTIDEIIDFFNRVKNVCINDRKHMSFYIKFSKILSLYLSEKLNVDKDIIKMKYLQEDICI